MKCYSKEVYIKKFIYVFLSVLFCASKKILRQFPYVIIWDNNKLKHIVYSQSVLLYSINCARRWKKTVLTCLVFMLLSYTDICLLFDCFCFLLTLFLISHLISILITCFVQLQLDKQANISNFLLLSFREKKHYLHI